MPVATPSNNGPLCFGEVATFTVQDAQGASYAWYDANPATPGANLVSQQRTFAQAGLAVGAHTRYVVVTVNNCASPAASTTVTITAQPTAAPSYTYTVAADCSAEDLQLFANASAAQVRIRMPGAAPMASRLRSPVR